MLSLGDEAGHNKDKYGKVHHRSDYLLVATEERTGGAEPRNDLISMQYPKRAQDTQKAQTFPHYGCEEGYDCRHVRPGGRVNEFLHRMRAYIEAGRKISENTESEDHIEPFDPVRARQKRRAYDKRDRERIENEKPVTKLLRNTAFAEIEAAQLIVKGSFLSMRFGWRRRAGS